MVSRPYYLTSSIANLHIMSTPLEVKTVDNLIQRAQGKNRSAFGCHENRKASLGLLTWSSQLSTIKKRTLQDLALFTRLSLVMGAVAVFALTWLVLALPQETNAVVFLAVFLPVGFDYELAKPDFASLGKSDFVRFGIHWQEAEAAISISII